MSKMIRVSEKTHKVLSESSNLTGISVGEILDNLIEEKTSKDIIRTLIGRMRKESQ